ncbi:hypothetical protein KIN20_020337 [Parelaphostrongylus tenuis]|uniref:Histone H4 n=1 Tax=Parelaphostrongylus tenuis TaxID=148309 RepID=A0AAD5N3Z3_PARTN|nr:hypothetical protein KIN20_020337 [Parelaphostrongylus tenuis]
MIAILHLAVGALQQFASSCCGEGSEGLDKGEGKSHRNVLRDKIQAITKPAIRRLAHRGRVTMHLRTDLRGDSWS